MDELIERGSKLYDFEELAWNRGDVLGIASAQQAQRDLETELYSQETRVRKPSRLSGIMKPVLAGASIVLGAMAGVIYDNKIGSELAEDKIVYSSENNIQFVPYMGTVQENPITDGQTIVLEENGKIVTFNTTDSTFTQGNQLAGGLKHLRIDGGSLSFQNAYEDYILIAQDSEDFLNVLESASPGTEPIWYTTAHHSDGTHILRAGIDGGVVREKIVSGEEQVVYSSGLVSKLRIDGDLNLFVAEEDIGGSIHERVLLVDSNDAANTKVIYDGPVEFLELSNESIYVGIQNPQDYQTINLHVFDLDGNQAEESLIGLRPNSFDVDAGVLVKFENNGTIYAVDVATGIQTVVSASNSVKSDIDLEGSIATWREDGTRIAYTNEIESALVEDEIVYSEGNNLDFDFINQKINFVDAPISIDTDGERISVLTDRPAINTVDLNTLGVLPAFNFDDNKIYKDFSLDEGVVSVKAKHASDETFDIYFQDFENDLQGNLLPATRQDQGYTYWDYNHDSDSGRIIINHENSAYLMNLSDAGAEALKSAPSAGANHIDPQVDGDNVIFREYYSDAIFLSDDEFSFTQKIIDKGSLESVVLDGDFVAYTFNNGPNTELWVYDINENADKLISNDFNPAGEIDLSNGNISWLEVNNYKSEIHVHNIEHGEEAVFGETYISRRDLKFGGSVLTWIQGALGGEEEAYFADIEGYNFHETNLTLEEVLPEYNFTDIQNEVNNQTSENVTLNRTDMVLLLDRINELENESAEYNLTLEYVAELLIEIREEREAEEQLLTDFQEDWAATNQSLSNVSAVPEEEDFVSKYGFWIGTAAATLTVGGFLLQNKRIRKLKPQLLESIVGEMGLKPGESKVIPQETLPKHLRGTTIIVKGDFVSGDKHNEKIDVPVYKGEVNIATRAGIEEGEWRPAGEVEQKWWERGS
ncbi:MAG: hypothetical protein QF460_02700 [Candidatus Nanoarchaeia archaeon]|nr:hypothetical protein [Candidatus Nanoarchaeia archaeon]|tara:strand:- start:426 stop:3215 length:2790 start_codon:yes stop_codon:yes gene_type:complete